MAKDAPEVVDHPLRGLYRLVSFVLGAAMVVFGVVVLIVTAGDDLFGQVDASAVTVTNPDPLPGAEGDKFGGTVRVLGLTANPALGAVSIAIGFVTAVVAMIGRNVDARFNVVLGYAFLFVGLAGLLTIRTSVNVMAFSMTNALVAFLVGLTLIAAGMYGRVTLRGGSATKVYPATDRLAGVRQNTTS